MTPVRSVRLMQLTKRLPQSIHLLGLSVNSSPCGHECCVRQKHVLTSATCPFPSHHTVCFLNTSSFVKQDYHRKTTEAVPLISELGGFFGIAILSSLSHPSADSTSVHLSSCFQLVFSSVVHLFKSFGEPELKSVLLNLKQSKPRGQIGSSCKVPAQSWRKKGRKGLYSVWFLGCN